MPVGANSASVHPDGNRFVIGGVDFYVYVYDYNSGEQLGTSWRRAAIIAAAAAAADPTHAEVHKGHHGPVHSVSYAPDGETYASGYDRQLARWRERSLTHARRAVPRTARSASGRTR